MLTLARASQAVYELPTSNADERKDSLALALQSLFVQLQVGNCAVSTKQLTHAFGWDSAESFLQHDVQELNRVLCDKLEEKMKGTPVEGTMQALFEGHTTTYIECLDVSYSSSRDESFLDLQLDVRGCHNVLASFERFVEAEQLEGENAYEAEGFGLQRARKGVRFTSLPPVLQLQLKRFEFDSARGSMQKLNDRYEFPLDLDLRSFVHAPSGQLPTDCRYTLHSVLVHSGGACGGHYYAYVRPTCTGSDWFCFDDDRVTRVDASRAVEENFGDSGLDTQPPVYGTTLQNAPGGVCRGSQFSSAYMLVYVRQQDAPRVLCPHSEADIPERVRLRIAAQAAEDLRMARERDEAHMLFPMRVATDRCIYERVSAKSAFAAFDLVDWDRVVVLRVARHATFLDFKKQAAAQLGVAVELQRWWCWSKRQNGTFRPCRPVLGANADEFASLFCVEAPAVPINNHLYLETLPVPALRLAHGAEHALLFFKVRLRALRLHAVAILNLVEQLYEPSRETLSFLGSAFVSRTSRVGDLRVLCAPLARLHTAAAELIFFEEVKFDPLLVEAISTDATLAAAEIGHGDIIVVQRTPAFDGTVRYPLAPVFFAHIKNRLLVAFQRRSTSRLPSKPTVLELTVTTTVGEARIKLATVLGLHATQQVQFTKPYGSPLALRPLADSDLMSTLLRRCDGSFAGMLMFDVLNANDILKRFSISWMQAPSEPRVNVTLTIGLGNAVLGLLALLVTKLDDSRQLPRGFNRQLRVLQLSGNTIVRQVDHGEAVDDLDDSLWRFRAEPVPDEQLLIEPGERVVHVAHVRRGSDTSAPVVPFGEPFLLKLREDDSLGTVKTRVAALLGLDAASATFASVRWGTVDGSGVFEPILSDSHPVMCRFVQHQSGYADFATYLALEHAESTTRVKRSRAQNDGQALRSVHNRQLRIYN